MKRTQLCEKCEQELPIHEFGDERDPYCGPCMERSFTSPHWRIVYAQEDIGHTIIMAAKDIRFALYEQQNRCCVICGKECQRSEMMLDHDHSTGFVRGLLCRACNTGLGFFRDNTEYLERAIKYLRHNRVHKHRIAYTPKASKYVKKLKGY